SLFRGRSCRSGRAAHALGSRPPGRESLVGPRGGAHRKGLLMAQNSLSGAEARRYVRAGQLAAAVLAVAAVSLWALDVPGMDRLPAPPVVKPAEDKAATPAVAQAARIDADGVQGLAVRLDEARLKEPVVAQAPPQPEPPAPPSGPE